MTASALEMRLNFACLQLDENSIIQLIRELCEPSSVSNASSAAAAGAVPSSSSSRARIVDASSGHDDAPSPQNDPAHEDDSDDDGDATTIASQIRTIARHFAPTDNNLCRLAPLIASLAGRLRVIKCPHTRPLPAHTMRAWDAQFAHVLLFSLFREHPAIAWKRLLLSLMLQDLHDTQPYDGSEGPVRQLFLACLELPSEKETLLRCDVAARAELMLDSSIFAPFRAPTPLLLCDALGGFTLLHCLSAQRCPLHAQSSDHGLLCATKLTKAGIRVNETDSAGRTALHVAAAVLNLDMLHGLVGVGASLSVKDVAGRTPLHTLVETLARKRWRDCTTGEMIVKALLALTGYDFSVFWDLGTNPTTPEWLSATGAYRRKLEGNLLCMLAQCGDEAVVREVVVRVKAMTSSASWSTPVLRFLLMRCVRMGMEQGVEAVWGAFEGVFAVHDEADTDRLQYLHHALSAATAAGRFFALVFFVRKVSQVRPGLERLVVRGDMFGLSPGSGQGGGGGGSSSSSPGGTVSDSAGPLGWEDVSVISPHSAALRPLLCLSPFLHLALLRGDPTLLDLLLFGDALLPSHILSPCTVSMDSPPVAPSSSSSPSSSFPSSSSASTQQESAAAATSAPALPPLPQLSAEILAWLPFLSPAVVRAAHTFSPLELACLRGDQEALHKMLSFLRSEPSYNPNPIPYP